jgi:molybdenum cofactor synthesis domain-containing protein
METLDMPRVAILTISDLASQGKREDLSGSTVKDMLRANNYDVVASAVVADERLAISRIMCEWADTQSVDLILTTGGTGLSARDVTPEATIDILHWQVPGIAEAMRWSTFQYTERSILSRSVAGVRGQCLIVNLPGSPKGVEQCLQAVLPAIGHAVEVLAGNQGH